jgi:hypothetical protein
MGESFRIFLVWELGKSIGNMGSPFAEIASQSPEMTAGVH